MLTHAAAWLALLAAPVFLAGQGCIIAHSVGDVGGPESQGGYLKAGHWELSIGFRHQYSFRHFVGSTEQVYRAQQGSEVRNRINLLNADLTYQVSSRWSVDLNVPLEFATRRYTIPGTNPPATERLGDYGLSGQGDISLSARRWMWDPDTNPSHNIQLGLGLQAPTGSDNIQNNLITTPGGAPVYATADYSIQPGIGGWGVNLEWSSFQQLGPQTQLFFNGTYLITPGETNGVATGQATPQTAYVSIADEYLLQPGVAYSFESVKGLSLTFDIRDEGVPAHDLIGGSEGWRRPGYAVSLEPGFEYAFHGGNDLLSASVARALYRNRTRSVPDTELGTHGDAAFADYVWLAGFTHRF